MADGKDNAGQADDVMERLQWLEEENRQLRERESMYTQFLDSIQDMIFCKDAGSHIVYANRAFREFYGMSMDELNGMIDAPFNQSEWTQQYLIDDAYVRSGNILTIEEEPVTRHDGEVRYFNTIKSPIFSASGAVGLTVGVSRDITERKEMDRRVSEFNSMVSHELRTPLTAIRAALGLIEGGTTEPLDDVNMDLINIARTECDRMIRLINDLLDIKKIAANKLDMNIQILDPLHVVRRVCASMASVAQEAGIELQCAVDDTRLFTGDPDRIIQVLANLTSNAIKFSAAETAVRLITTPGPEGFIKFAVEDRGPGIAETDFDKLFVAFQQLDSSDTRAKGGTGLGLAISKAIVRRHGGNIGFETNLGKGTTFWFTLPLHRVKHPS